MAAASEQRLTTAWLVPVAGPHLSPVDLKPGAAGLILGRSESSGIRLAADSVSRRHARLDHDGTRWRLTDLKSRWGTFLNGQRVAADHGIVLADGDFIRINPWTFRLASAGRSAGGVLDGAMDAVDDVAEAANSVHTLVSERLPSLGDEMLSLLLDAAGAIHAAADEKTLAEVLIGAARQGSGLPNAAVLRPAGAAGRFEVIAARSPNDGGEIAYSRALLTAAADGNVAELSADRQSFDVSQSVVNLGVRSGLCVPILLGQTVAAYLYLDSRGQSADRLPLRPNASALCLALGRIAGLALANLKRLEMERRGAELEADLAAAAAAQQWILPEGRATLGRFCYTGQCRPGQYVGGDFYDIIPLADDRLAIAIGDVSGHGVAASVLMTASAGFLHAVLQQAGDVGTALNRLNVFIGPRKPYGKFVTLWVGLLDLAAGTLTYIDAGHGYLLLDPGDGELRQLSIGDNFPLGVDETFIYPTKSSPLPPHGRLLLLSDGVVEQPAAVPSDASEHPRPFGVEGVQSVFEANTSDDPIAALFAALERHAGQPTLADDATAVLVKW